MRAPSNLLVLNRVCAAREGNGRCHTHTHPGPEVQCARLQTLQAPLRHERVAPPW